MQYEDEAEVIQTLALEIKRRFLLDWDSTQSVLPEQIDSFLGFQV